MNVRSVVVGRVGVCILCIDVSEEGVDGESTGSEESFLMSYTLRNVSVADLGRDCQFGFRL